MKAWVFSVKSSWQTMKIGILSISPNCRPNTALIRVCIKEISMNKFILLNFRKNSSEPYRYSNIFFTIQCGEKNVEKYGVDVF